MKTSSKLLNLVVYALVPTIGHSQQNINDKPNFIIFISDDHSADDTGFMGNKDVVTPVLDNLASEGMVFSNAFATTSISAPSRSALYTGLYPHRNGCHQQSGQIYNHIKTLPVYLKNEGYRVALAGKTHVKPESSFPFEYMELNDFPSFLKSVSNQPFCLIIAYRTPHEPYFNKKDGVDYNKIQSKKWMPNTPETMKLIAGSYDNVENLDNEIGASLYWIEKIGLPKNTVQIYTSDHGSGLPFSKWTLYEEGLHVPLIMKWKEIIEPGTKTTSLVSLVDILPTILDIAGIAIPENIDGKSLMPLIRGEKNKQNDFIYGAYSNLGVSEGNRYPIRSIRNERYKLIINFNYKESFSIRNTVKPDERSIIDAFRVIQSWRDISDSNSFARERYNQFLNRPKLELYDLCNDPFELNNLANDKKYNKVEQELIEEMKKWLVIQGDKIIKEL